MRKFDEGSSTGFVEPPVPSAWTKWVRGDAKLVSIKDTDPGAYFGGFRAFLSHKDRNSDDQIENPKLPIPVVKRVSDDGKHPYTVYATNILHFLPITFRLRYEYREKIRDEQTGKDTERVVSTSRNHQPGYQPNKQIFGLVFDAKTNAYAPAILFIANWSGFISLNKAADTWKKVKVPDGKILIRRYGSVGITDGQGNVMPKFETFGQGRSTPIDAVDVAHPRFIDALPEFDDLFDKAQAWKECEHWNAEGKVTEEDPANGGDPDLIKIDQLADEAGLTNIEKAALIAENNGNYKMAIEALSYKGEPSEEDINAIFSETDQDFG